MKDHLIVIDTSDFGQLLYMCSLCDIKATLYLLIEVVEDLTFEFSRDLFVVLHYLNPLLFPDEIAAAFGNCLVYKL